MDIFRPDNPVFIKTDDKFQRYSFAQRIAQIIGADKRPSSLVVGIYGKWGEGKTSVINFIKEELPSDTVIINFNPWSFSDEKHLITAFFGNIAAAVGKKLTTKKERALQIFKGYADGIGSVSSLFHSGLGEIFKSGGKIVEKFQKNTLEALKGRIDELIIEADTNFVIFIDDIDRLEAPEVQAIFKLVKLLGDFPRTAYVLSFDDEMVAAALGPKYGNRDRKSGYDFLEKIIQIPLQLPKASNQALRAYTFELLDKASDSVGIDLTKDETEDFINKFDKAFLPALINPRLAVRYANSISFSLPLLNGEVNLSDLVIIEGIKVFYPALYHFIRNSREVFIRNYSNSGNIISSATKEDKEYAKEAIHKLLDIYSHKDKILSMLVDLFPQLGIILSPYGHPHDNPEDWYRKKRICSPYYFERYFSYVVQKGDISDVYFKELLSELDTSRLETIIGRFENAIPKMEAEMFVFKLRQFVPTYNQTQAKMLALTLAHFGEYYSKIPSMLFFSGREQVSSIVKDLIENIPRTERLIICIDVLNHAKPLEFAMQILDRLRVKPRYSDEASFLDSDELKQISEYLVLRFISEAQEKSIFELLSDQYLWIIFELFIEADKQKEATELLSNILQADDRNVLAIIKIFTPTIVTSDKPGPYKTDFKYDNYNALKKFIDPFTIYAKTILVFGKKTYTSSANSRHEELTDDNLIGVFQKIHEESIGKEEEPSPETFES